MKPVCPKRKAERNTDSPRNSSTPSRPKAPKERKVQHDQTWDDDDELFKIGAIIATTPTKPLNSPYKRVCPLNYAKKKLDMPENIPTQQMKIADFREEANEMSQDDSDAFKDDDFEEDAFEDDNFDVSVLETSISKMDTQPTCPTNVIKVADEWAIPPNIETNNREYPLVKQHMDQYLRIKGLPDLYQWQKECLRLQSVINGSNLIFSLPTSAGKSLVAEVHLLNHLLKGNNALLILPFVSIVQEKVAAMSYLARETGQKFVVEEYAGGSGRIPPVRRRSTPALFIGKYVYYSFNINNGYRNACSIYMVIQIEILEQ